MKVFRQILSLALCILLCVSTHASVQYPAVVPGVPIEFPRDEGSHPLFRTEWWYVTGWVEDTAGPLGFQITFFRYRPASDADNPSRFAPRQLLFAHAAVSDPRRTHLLKAAKSARAGFGLAEAHEGFLSVVLDDWRLQRNSDGNYEINVKTAEFSFQLRCQPTQPPLLQGRDGFSQKGPKEQSASYYYSLPQLKTTGVITTAGRARTVSGTAWFDHEWSSEYMDPQARGWDWIGINLQDGGALMAFRMRAIDGTSYWSAATRRAARSVKQMLAPYNESHTVTYQPDQIRWTPLRDWRSPRTQVAYPVEWRVLIGSQSFVLKPMFDDQEHDARDIMGILYWEGAVNAYDESGNLVGRGYLELTGYDTKLDGI